MTEVTPVEHVVHDGVTLRSLPLLLAEDDQTSDAWFEEKMYTEATLPSALRSQIRPKDVAAWPGSEVRTVVSSGQVHNRINLTIVGDGYTAEEKERFFEDCHRIARELFGENTFKSYLPLFNVHAVFVPSKESGITDIEDKDTALELYRSPRGSKRGIMPGNYRQIDKAIDLAPATDYPILVANDDYYGGLGGRYAITTRSPQSGTMVLRHELGHNFGNVGEEYDGGSAYMGANHSWSEDVSWRHWVDGELKVHEARNLFVGYPWKNLENGPVTVNFTVPRPQGEQPTCVGMDVSSVGWETPEDVSIKIDGQPVATTGIYTDDRSFHRLGQCTPLAPGRHRLEISENVHDHNNVVANLRGASYGPDYDFTPGVVAAFPTFNSSGDHVGYRPTHESCLMRDMRSTQFCAVDQENMWHEFLQRVSLIDGVDVQTDHDGPDEVKRTVRVRTPGLDGLDIRWYRVNADGSESEVESLHNQREWHPSKNDHNAYRVKVHFHTPEVRQYNNLFYAQEDVRL